MVGTLRLEWREITDVPGGFVMRRRKIGWKDWKIFIFNVLALPHY